MFEGVEATYGRSTRNLISVQARLQTDVKADAQSGGSCLAVTVRMLKFDLCGAADGV